MRNNILVATVLGFLAIGANAQRNNHISIAVTNNNTAIPLSKLGTLFKAPLHPGFELGYGFIWKTKPRHDWFQTIKAGYFYHRFVQHAIPVYTTFGYRYRFNNTINAETSLGAGYLHSIAATGKYKLNSNGEYESDKGVGRMQAIALLNISAGYVLNAKAARPKTVFVGYQQRLQMPFIQSYVPLLPYNSFMVGIKLPTTNRK